MAIAEVLEIGAIPPVVRRTCDAIPCCRVNPDILACLTWPGACAREGRQGVGTADVGVSWHILRASAGPVRYLSVRGMNKPLVRPSKARLPSCSGCHSRSAFSCRVGFHEVYI